MQIPNGQSEAVIRRMTDNAMAKRKGTQRKTMVNKILTQKIKDLAMRTPTKSWVNRRAPE